MSVDIHNSEGYVDPTAFEALSGIEHEEQKALRTFRPIVYICSPYAGDIETNVVAARRYSRLPWKRLYPHRTAPAVSTVFE